MYKSHYRFIIILYQNISEYLTDLRKCSLEGSYNNERSGILIFCFESATTLSHLDTG